jgi:hypothetical protein
MKKTLFNSTDMKKGRERSRPWSRGFGFFLGGAFRDGLGVMNDAGMSRRATPAGAASSLAAPYDA